jgi:hypothetical protein
MNLYITCLALVWRTIMITVYYIFLYSIYQTTVLLRFISVLRQKRTGYREKMPS